MLIRRILFVALTSVIFSIATAEESEEVQGSDREGKLFANFPLIKIVTFGNAECNTTNGGIGTCYTESECEQYEGIEDGECAEGYGVCCQMPNGGDVTITQSGEEFMSKNYPMPYTMAGITVAELVPPSGTVQIKLTFIDFHLAPPTEGDCSNDTFIVTGGNPGIELPILCGHNTDQHMFIDVDNSDGPYKLITTLAPGSDMERKWKIKVEYFSVDDCGRAPFRCTQYCNDPEGTIMSFNYDDEDPVMLNNQKYTICLGYVKGKCDIGLTFERIDLGNINGDCDDDYVSVGCSTLCADKIDYSVQVNVTTSPVLMHVSSNDENTNLEEGFKAKYMMMDC